MERTKTKTIQIKVPSVKDVMGKNLPEKKYRAGAVAATIWANEVIRDGKQVTYRTVSLERSYKDKDDEWKSTNSLRVTDIPKAVLVLQKAFEYIALSNNSTEEDIY